MLYRYKSQIILKDYDVPEHLSHEELRVISFHYYKPLLEHNSLNRLQVRLVQTLGLESLFSLGIYDYR